MTKIGNFTLYNLDRQESCVFGGAPSDHDFCHVYDDSGKLVKFGTLKECYEFIQTFREAVTSKDLDEYYCATGAPMSW